MTHDLIMGVLGSEAEETQRALDFIRSDAGSAGPATVIGQRVKASCLDASFVNAVMIRALRQEATMLPSGIHGTAIDGNFVVVAIHEKPIVIPPFDLLMPEIRLTGVALSCNDFPSVIDAMAAGTFPTEGWVSTIPLEGIVENGFARLHRQEALKLLVDLSASAS